MSKAKRVSQKTEGVLDANGRLATKAIRLVGLDIWITGAVSSDDGWGKVFVIPSL